jgi:hypothetical protein
MLRDHLPSPVRRVARRVRFRLRHRGLATTFERIHHENYWADGESRSGPGSGASQTARLVAELPGLLASVGARSVLDIPCGDFAWMQHVDLTDIDYIGGDIVASLVEDNNARFGGDHVRFDVLDLTSDALPRCDVVLVRDCLVHLSHRRVWRALQNVKASGSTWLLTTTHPEHPENPDVSTGRWRPLSLTAPPFAFPAPHALLVEGCTERDGRHRDKSLGLWRVADLPGQPGG